MKKRHYPYVLVLPAFILVMLFLAYPLFEVFRVSFTDTFLLRPTSGGFVGLKTYYKVLSDEEFPAVFLRTLFWMGIGTSFSMIFGLAIGYFLSFDWTVNRILRAVIIIPWIIPPVVSANTWGWMMHGRFGVINDILMKLGLIDEGIAFLGEPKIALFALSQILVWKNVPIVAILLSAAFQGVPQSLIEAARIDGANGWQIFTKILFPAIRHTFLVVIVMVSIWCIQQFVIIWVTTQGGPVNASHILPTYIYETAFINYRFGEAGVLSVINILFLVAISGVYLKIFKQK